METIYFWNGWEPVIRIFIVGSITYLGLVILLRLSGRRTLTYMTSFDFVIAIALGSAFGRILTAKGVSISEALATFVLLIILQTIFSFFALHSKLFKKFTTPRPSLLFYRGEFLEKNMRKARIRKDELLSESRKKGVGSMSEVEIIIFETDGSFSVIKKSDAGEPTTYEQLVEK